MSKLQKYLMSAAVLLFSVLFSAHVYAASNIIILGDSRAEDMHTFVGDAGVSWCYKVGMGYLWMLSDGFPTIDGDVGAGTAVVITLGVNDVVDQFRIPQYAEAINAKAAEWRARGAQTFYVSITPVDDALDSYEHNSDIEYWNSTIRSLLSTDVYYLDIYYAVLGNYATVDGLHYTADTYRRIFDLIISGVEEAGYFPEMEEFEYEDDGMPRGTMTVADTEGDWAHAGGEDSGAESPMEEGSGSGTAVSPAGSVMEGSRAEMPETADEDLSGWQQKGDDTFYYVDGRPVTGLQTIDDKLYFFNENGALARGWVHSGDYTYAAGQDGVIHTGWISDGQHWYYADESGILVRGWFRRDGNRYYADKNGVICSGWLTDRDHTYYLDTDGHALCGWYSIDGKIRYFDEIGIMAQGECSIDGETWEFGEDGELLKSPDGTIPDAKEIITNSAG